MKFSQIIACILCSLCLSGHPPVFAQEPPAEEQPVVVLPVEQDRGPEDALNRGTPRGAAVGFIAASEEPNFEKAANYLDLRNLPDEVAEIGGHELARQLYQVISRAFWLDDFTLSDRPEGVQGDGLPEYRDEFVPITTPDGREYRLWLQRVPRGDGVLIWKVSNRSVALIPELYEEFSYPPLIETIRKWFPEESSFLGLETFKWFILLAAGVITWPLFWLIGWVLGRLFSSPERDTYPLVRKFFGGPFVLLGYLLVVGILLRELGVGAYAREVMEARTVSTIVVVWLLWSLTNLFRAHKQRKLEAAGRPGAAKLLRPMTGLIKIVILIFGVLFWLNNLGVNITTLLAGLGVGGLAVALALQKPLEDMMGALTIFTQAPMRVGDFVRYGEVTGIVEDIGLRTTRVRTLNNTVVSIPNARIAHTEVENLSYREKIRYQPTLRLRYDTTLEQLQKIRDGIWSLLTEHEGVYGDPIRVRFTDFEKDAILMKVHCFLKTTDYTEFLEIGEQLNYRIMEIVESVGASFALPSSTVVVEGDRPALGSRA
jgi:MscS family membrane protein